MQYRFAVAFCAVVVALSVSGAAADKTDEKYVTPAVKPPPSSSIPVVNSGVISGSVMSPRRIYRGSDSVIAPERVADARVLSPGTLAHGEHIHSTEVMTDARVGGQIQEDSTTKGEKLKKMTEGPKIRLDTTKHGVEKHDDEKKDDEKEFVEKKTEDEVQKEEKFVEDEKREPGYKKKKHQPKKPKNVEVYEFSREQHPYILRRLPEHAERTLLDRVRDRVLPDDREINIDEREPHRVDLGQFQTLGGGHASRIEDVVSRFEGGRPVEFNVDQVQSLDPMAFSNRADPMTLNNRIRRLGRLWRNARLAGSYPIEE